MARKPKELTLSFDPAAGKFKELPGYPSRPKAESIALRRELDVERPPVGVHTRPTLRDIWEARRSQSPATVQGGGLGTPIWQRFRYYETGKLRGLPKGVVSVPAALAVGFVGLWVAERIVVDASRWVANSFHFGKPRPTVSFLSWVAGNIIPGAADIHALSTQIQSAARGGAGPPPAPGKSGPSIDVNSETPNPPFTLAASPLSSTPDGYTRVVHTNFYKPGWSGALLYVRNDLVPYFVQNGWTVG